jgi:hypothetical protein
MNTPATARVIDDVFSEVAATAVLRHESPDADKKEQENE